MIRGMTDATLPVKLEVKRMPIGVLGHADVKVVSVFQYISYIRRIGPR